MGQYVDKLVSLKDAKLILDSKSETFNLADSNWEKDAYRCVECVPCTKGVEHTTRGWVCRADDQTLQIMIQWVWFQRAYFEQDGTKTGHITVRNNDDLMNLIYVARQESPPPDSKLQPQTLPRLPPVIVGSRLHWKNLQPKTPEKRLVEVLVWTLRLPTPYRHNRATEPRPDEEKCKSLEFQTFTFETKTTSAKGMKSSKLLPTFSTSTETLMKSWLARYSSINSRFSLFLPSRWIQLKSSSCSFRRSWRLSSGKPSLGLQNIFQLNWFKIWRSHRDWCGLWSGCHCFYWLAPRSLGRCDPCVWNWENQWSNSIWTLAVSGN